MKELNKFTRCCVVRGEGRRTDILDSTRTMLAKVEAAMYSWRCPGKIVLKREKFPNTRKAFHCQIFAKLWKHKGQHKGDKNK